MRYRTGILLLATTLAACAAQPAAAPPVSSVGVTGPPATQVGGNARSCIDAGQAEDAALGGDVPAAKQHALDAFNDGQGSSPAFVAALRTLAAAARDLQPGGDPQPTAAAVRAVQALCAAG